jgi:hypothetical protein
MKTNILSKLKLPPVGRNDPTGVEQERNDVEIGYGMKSFFAGLRRAKTSRGDKWAASLEAPRRPGCRRLVSTIQVRRRDPAEWHLSGAPIHMARTLGSWRGPSDHPHGRVHEIWVPNGDSAFPTRMRYCSVCPRSTSALIR